MLRSTLARFLFAQLILLTLFVLGFASFSFTELTYLLDRRDRQMVERELFRLTTTGGPDAVKSELHALDLADQRVVPDIFYIFVPDIRDCVDHHAAIGECADSSPWAAPAILRLKLDIAKVAAGPPGTPQSLQRQTDFTAPGLFPWYYLSARRVGDNSALLVGIDRKILGSEVTRFSADMVLAFAGFLVLLIAGATYYFRRVMLRIGHFSDALNQVAEGALATRVPLARAGFELTVLGRCINAMLGRIEDLVLELKWFTDSMAHDLRTPLTRLRMRLGRTEPNASREELQQRIAAGLKELDTVQKLFDASLKLAKSEASLRHRKVIDLAAEIANVVEFLEPLATAQGQKIVLDIKPVTLFGDEAMVQQLASNVMENAIKYSGKGSEIRISCGTGANAGFLEISDDGPGLAPEERNGLFRRFERGKTVGQTPGTGLGLYIVKRYANWLGMTITVDDNEPGLRLRFDFLVAGKTGVSLSHRGNF